MYKHMYTYTGSLTAGYGAVTHAGGTLCKKTFPTSLLLCTVVDVAAAFLGGTDIAFVGAGGGAGSIQLPLVDLNNALLTHP